MKSKDSHEAKKRIMRIDKDYQYLYIQDAYCKNPKEKFSTFYFRPQHIDASLFYMQCSLNTLLRVTTLQISLLEECCISYKMSEPRQCSILFKVEARAIPYVSDELIKLVDKLKKLHIDLIVDVNLKGTSDINVFQRSLYKIYDAGHSISLGLDDWRQANRLNIANELINYLRIGPSPEQIKYVNEYIDTCFYIKEKLGSNLILDKIGSRTSLDVACQTPYFSLMGEYISKVRLVGL